MAKKSVPKAAPIKPQIAPVPTELTMADSIRGYYNLAQSSYRAREDRLLTELKKASHPNHFAYHLTQKGTKSDMLASIKSLVEVT